MKILHLEDDTSIAFITKTVLEKFGDHTVYSIQNVYEALAEAENIKPDLFLVDMIMPELDGLQFMERIKKIEALKNTPYIFLTAKIQTHEKEKYLKSGATGVISKPYKVENLCEEIEKILHSQ